MNNKTFINVLLIRKIIPRIVWLIFLSANSKLFAQQNCEQAKADSLPGKWIKENDQTGTATDGGYPAAKLPDLLKSMDRYQALVKNLYPDLKGNKIVWNKRIFQDPVFKSNRPGTETHFFINKYVCNKGQFYDNIISERSAIFIYANSLEAIAKNSGMLQNGKYDTYKGLNIYQISYRLGNYKGHDYFEPPAGSGFSAGWGLEHFRLVLITYPGKLPFLYLTRAEIIDFLRQQMDENEKIETERLKLIYPVRSKTMQDAEKEKQIEKHKKEYPDNPRRLQRFLEDYKTDEQKFDDAAKGTRELFAKKRNRLKELEKKYEGKLEEIATLWQGNLHYSQINENWDFAEDKQKDDHLCNENGFCRHGNAWIVINEDYFDKKLAPHVPQFFTVSFAWRTNDFRSWFLKRKDHWMENFEFSKLAGMLGK